jgi:flagellar motor switch protein FliG
VLTGPEKAVLFLLSLDEEVARPIVAELDESDLRKLRAVASTMHEVQPDAIDHTFKEFVERSSKQVAVPRGGLPYLRRLSVGAIGDQRTREVFEDGVTSPFARLEVAQPDTVGSLLSKEPPQIVGAILAKLEPRAAAAILASMPVERQAAVVGHVGRLTEIPAKVLEDMAMAIANELPASDTTTLVSVDGVAKAAQILNAAGKASSAALLTALEEHDGDLARDVRQAMFTFEDLQRVDPRSMREILREVPTERLTMALKDAPQAVASAIFAGLSARAGELIRDDLAVLGNLRKTEIDRARLEVVQIALQLEADGKVDLGRGNE